jgi:AraC-like DNA-binding protein
LQKIARKDQKLDISAHMKVLPDLEPDLRQLARSTPRDYFHGVQATERCRPDNLLAFLRTERRVLHETGFATRPHHRYVLLINLETTGTVSVDGVAYRIHPREAFLIAPFQLHFYLDVADESIRWLYFTFEAPDRAPFEAFLNARLALRDAELREAVRLAQMCARAELAGAGAREALVLGFELFLNRLRQLGLGRTLPAASSPREHYALLDRINRLLAWHLEERMNIAGLAARLGWSESHLRKRFLQLSGTSLGNYLLHYRLNRAIKLLVHSDLSLTQIAIDCGYESLAAFSRAFKSHVGKTPSAFRRAGQ